MVGLFAFFTNRWFINPDVTDTLVPADAIVVFPGGSSEERLERAIELAEQGLASVLFLPTHGRNTGLEAAICRGSDFEFATQCRPTDPVNTFGNAAVTADVAAENSWVSVILVTSDDHITRSHMLLDRCYDGAIQTAVSVKTEDRRRRQRVIHEWGGMIKAIFTDRC